MSYRKLKADYLFDGFRIVGKDSVLICRQDGTIEAIVEESEADGDLEIFQGMLTPGFINCHCHIELSHLKGLIPEKQGLVDFVLSVVGQGSHLDVVKQAAIYAAETAMLESGIIAVGDICNGADTRFMKSFRRMDYYNFIELLGWSPSLAASRFESAEKTAGLFRDSGTDQKHISLNPHAPYSVSDELWHLMQPGFKGKTITIHNQESDAENEYFKSGSGDLNRMYGAMKIDSAFFKPPGCSSLSNFLPKLKNASKILLVHNTYTEENDLLQAGRSPKDLFFCFCPNANNYIEGRIPDIPRFVKHSVSMVLGTDSLASNHQLSILEEIKTIRKTFPSIPTAQLLSWACSNGARALSFEEKLGDFTKGKKPGIVLIENTDGGEIGESSRSRRVI